MCCLAASGSLCFGTWYCAVGQQVVPCVLGCDTVLSGSKWFPVFWDVMLCCLAASGSLCFGTWYCAVGQQVVPCVLGCDAVLSGSKLFPVFWDVMLCCVGASGSLCFGTWCCVVWQQVVPYVLGYDAVSLGKWLPMVWRHHSPLNHQEPYTHTHTQWHNNRPEPPTTLLWEPQISHCVLVYFTAYHLLWLPWPWRWRHYVPSKHC